MKKEALIKLKIKKQKLRQKVKITKEMMLFLEILWEEFEKYKNILIQKVKRRKSKKYKTLLLLLLLE